MISSRLTGGRLIPRHIQTPRCSVPIQSGVSRAGGRSEDALAGQPAPPRRQPFPALSLALTLIVLSGLEPE